MKNIKRNRTKKILESCTSFLSLIKIIDNIESKCGEYTVNIPIEKINFETVINGYRSLMLNTNLISINYLL